MKKLFLIPARGGSKGLPRKNILPLAGKPMIHYTLDAAKEAAEQDDVICVSTDDQEIIEVVEHYGIKVPFVRPTELVTDNASSQQVIEHAIQWYAQRGQEFDVVVLLQVTSPLRNSKHVKEALELWSSDLDMVVSVKETDSNPYYVLFEENENGFLKKSKEGNFTRRQDCPKVYEYNGAIYIISTESLDNQDLLGMMKVKKYLMKVENSIDIDDKIDFIIVEKLLNFA